MWVLGLCYEFVCRLGVMWLCDSLMVTHISVLTDSSAGGGTGGSYFFNPRQTGGEPTRPHGTMSECKQKPAERPIRAHSLANYRGKLECERWMKGWSVERCCREREELFPRLQDSYRLRPVDYEGLTKKKKKKKNWRKRQTSRFLCVSSDCVCRNVLLCTLCCVLPVVWRLHRSGASVKDQGYHMQTHAHLHNHRQIYLYIYIYPNKV